MAAPDIFAYRKYWAKRFADAPVLPMSREEMEALGWDSCDIVIVTGDAYVDHPSFGAALIGRVLQAQGFRVGVVAQPDWRGPRDFAALGRPNLMFAVTSGNLDSMVNHYTADRKRRSDDAYTADDQPGRRPDRAVIVYANRCRQAFPGVPVVLGGLEASLRRASHYDHWSDRVRRCVLLDAKADLLIYGNAERPVVELAHRLAAGEPIQRIDDIPGTVLSRPAADTGEDALRLPSHEKCAGQPLDHLEAARRLHLQALGAERRPLVQRHGNRDVWLLPPPRPLSTRELDRVFELPYSRRPHPYYGARRLIAYEMIRFSVTILRGCFGGCTFCSLACHEGRVIQSRSEESILREIGTIRDTVPGFTGIISDLGGPTANMYRMGCGRPDGPEGCRRWSCLHPAICAHLQHDHRPLIRLYRRARELAGVRQVLVGSGVRHDLAVRSPEYVRELVTHHVGGYLKVAPEHVSSGPLALMLKPGIEQLERFQGMFRRFSEEAGKEQYLVPYFIAAHPGSSDEDMLELARWLKRNDFRPEQVQTFLPSPMTLASAMYHTGKNPLGSLKPGGEDVLVPRGAATRRLHKAFLRYHDPGNWPMLRKALRRMGRSDLIGAAKRCLVPAWQPKNLGLPGEGARCSRRTPGKLPRKKTRRGRQPR